MTMPTETPLELRTASQEASTSQEASGLASGSAPGARRRTGLRALALALLLAAALVPGAARADDGDGEVDWNDYDPQRAGNPVRIAAYVLHPFGVIVDYLILRPAWWIGNQEPFQTLFGVDDPVYGVADTPE